MAGESADPTQVAYAVAQIDRAIGGLYFEPFHDRSREAREKLANLEHLLSSMAEGVDECVGFEGAAAKIREAGERLSDARMLLASKGS